MYQHCVPFYTWSERKKVTRQYDPALLSVKERTSVKEINACKRMLWFFTAVYLGSSGSLRPSSLSPSGPRSQKLSTCGSCRPPGHQGWGYRSRSWCSSSWNPRMTSWIGEAKRAGQGWIKSRRLRKATVKMLAGHTNSSRFYFPSHLAWLLNDKNRHPHNLVEERVAGVHTSQLE